MKARIQKTIWQSLIWTLTFTTMACSGGSGGEDNPNVSTSSVCTDGDCLTKTTSTEGNFTFTTYVQDGAQGRPHLSVSGGDVMTVTCDSGASTDQTTSLTYATCSYTGDTPAYFICVRGNVAIATDSSSTLDDSGCQSYDIYCDADYGFYTASRCNGADLVKTDAPAEDTFVDLSLQKEFEE